jgi:short-subunit dehydrogenase
MKNSIDKDKFGPWAIITGASSGIGKEFARQLAACGLNLVLVARRLALLEEVGKHLAKEFGIHYLVVEADLAMENAIEKIANATANLDIGLLISNAGTGRPGRFLSFDEKDLRYILQLNAASHLSLTHHFGRRMAQRGKGGVLLTGAMGAVDGVPYMANESGTKGYIQSLGKSLHTEFKEAGLNITVLITSPTETPVLGQLGFRKDNTPTKPISAEQCVKEALLAFSANRITVLPGFKYRVMNALIPGALSRTITGKIIKKNNGI